MLSSRDVIILTVGRPYRDMSATRIKNRSYQLKPLTVTALTELLVARSSLYTSFINGWACGGGLDV